jgi:hypothetical protein
MAIRDRARSEINDPINQAWWPISHWVARLQAGIAMAPLRSGADILPDHRIGLLSVW